MSASERNSGRIPPALRRAGRTPLPFHPSRVAACILLSLWLGTVSAGCVIVDVGVTNPIPGLSTVAVAPFFNQSQERAVNGREVALAYYAELQKAPGFQVVPVGVTEVALREHNLDLSSPGDALRLAQILGVDAVVVGSITDFDPYYPPRIGLTVDWYSPHPWMFRADLPEEAECEPAAVADSGIGTGAHGDSIAGYKHAPAEPFHQRMWHKIRAVPLFRGQTPEPTDAAMEAPGVAAQAAPAAATWVPTQAARGGTVSAPGIAEPAVSALAETPDVVVAPPAALPATPLLPPSPPTSVVGPVGPMIMAFDPRQPLMSYTRLFDGADAEFSARLRDYLELRADLRSGSWAAAMRRTDEFVRFSSRLMVSEMLLLYGGEGRRRYVFKMREH